MNAHDVLKRIDAASIQLTAAAINIEEAAKIFRELCGLSGAHIADDLETQAKYLRESSSLIDKQMVVHG